MHVQPAPPLQVTPFASAQASPAQQVAALVQAWPTWPQVAPGWQVPMVAPPGMAQERPRQQSLLAVQEPFWGWQAGCAWQVPLTQ